MQSVCMLSHHAEVCTTPLHAGSSWKSELRNCWGDVPRDNFWSDSATGNSGRVYYRGLSYENCKSCEWATSWWSYPS